MRLAFTDVKRAPIFVHARALSNPAEDRDRVLYQSARTVAGQRAPLPLSEVEAWEQAPAEYSARQNHG